MDDAAEIQLSGAELESLTDGGRGARRKSKKRIEARTGFYRRAVPVRPGEKDFDLSFDATLRRAVLRQAQAGAGRSRIHLRLETQDLCRKVRFRPSGHLIVFLVDASDSMGSGTEIRMRAAQGAILGILRRAYLNRDQVAMAVFGGEEARVVLAPTRGVDLARARLRGIATGGATPFAHGLQTAWQIIRQERMRNPNVRPILVIISDGEANVPLAPGANPWEDLLELAAALRRDRIVSILIDAVSRFEPSQNMPRLAQALGAACIRADRPRSRQIIEAVRKIEDGDA